MKSVIFLLMGVVLVSLSWVALAAEDEPNYSYNYRNDFNDEQIIELFAMPYKDFTLDNLFLNEKAEGYTITSHANGDYELVISQPPRWSTLNDLYNEDPVVFDQLNRKDRKLTHLTVNDPKNIKGLLDSINNHHSINRVSLNFNQAPPSLNILTIKSLELIAEFLKNNKNISFFSLNTSFYSTEFDPAVKQIGLSIKNNSSLSKLSLPAIISDKINYEIESAKFWSKAATPLLWERDFCNIRFR